MNVASRQLTTHRHSAFAEDWGLGLAPTTQVLAAEPGSEGSTLTLDPAVNGSTLIVDLDSIYADVSWTSTGGVQLDSGGNAVETTCIQGSGSFQNPTQCPNNQSSMTFTLDGTPGTITITPKVAGVGTQTVDRPAITIVIPGAGGGKPILISPNAGNLPSNPGGGESAPGGTKAGGSGPPSSSTSTSPSTAGYVIAGVVVVAAIGGTWWFSR
ncbi:MAG TPA: hypothetical protein VMI75_04470 [Polyangiaceae bacterium]|nr:hypothetical protein [Polyangiaceae bacterium]